jgi:hypothetical protein
VTGDRAQVTVRFESRVFWLSKDADEPAQYQDAFALDAETGRAAVADGVSSAIFSGPWARLLTLGAVAEPPPLEDGDAFQAWLAEKRTAWINNIDTSKLTWYQRPKMADGAMTTLLWLELTPAETNDEGRAVRYQLQAFAIGDTCLFYIRDGQTLFSFPLEKSVEFGLNPAVVASVDRKLDHLLEFKARSCDGLPGDLLVLATDAIALWAIERQESGETIDWSHYWNLGEEEWRGEIFALRDAKQMRFDDSTLVLLRVIEERPAPAVTLPEAAAPELVTATDAVPQDEAEAETPQSDYAEEQVEAVTPSDQGEVASLTEVVEGNEALQFDAAIEEGIETLHDAASVNEGEENDAEGGTVET